MSKKNTYNIFAGLLVIAVSLSFITSVSAEDFRIGALLNLSGFGAEWGKNARRGIELALEEVNAAGGINGEPVSVIFEDGRSGDLAACATAAQKLIHIDKVNVLLTQWTGDTEVAWPIAYRQGILTVSLSAGAPGLVKGRPLLLDMWGEDTALIKELVRSIVSKNSQRVGIVVVQDPYFLALAKALRQELSTYGITPVIDREVLPSANQIRGEALRIKSAAAESVVSLVYYSQQASLLMELEALRTSPAVYGIIGSEHENFLKLAGHASNGLLIPTYDLKPSSFVDRFQNKWGELPWLSSDTAYDAVNLLVHLTRQGHLSGIGITKAAQNLTGYSGASGTITFSKDGQRIDRATRLLEVRDGKVE